MIIDGLINRVTLCLILVDILQVLHLYVVVVNEQLSYTIYMWTCSSCGRRFNKENQPHSCKTIPFNEHFKHKDKAKELFDYLLDQITDKIGKCEIISLPCCIHLFGKYDFLAALPKKDSLEIRFALERVLDDAKLTASVPLSTKTYKNCLVIVSTKDINYELLEILREAYFLKS